MFDFTHDINVKRHRGESSVFYDMNRFVGELMEDDFCIFLKSTILFLKKQCSEPHRASASAEGLIPAYIQCSPDIDSVGVIHISTYEETVFRFSSLN
jgi:hypothetical protein